MMIQPTPVVKPLWLDENDTNDSAAYAMPFDTRFNNLEDIFREYDYIMQNINNKY